MMITCTGVRRSASMARTPPHPSTSSSGWGANTNVLVEKNDGDGRRASNCEILVSDLATRARIYTRIESPPSSSMLRRTDTLK